MPRIHVKKDILGRIKRPTVHCERSEYAEEPPPVNEACFAVRVAEKSVRIVSRPCLVPCFDLDQLRVDLPGHRGAVQKSRLLHTHERFGISSKFVNQSLDGAA